MNTIDQGSRRPNDGSFGGNTDWSEAEGVEDNFKPLTAQEARAWRAQQRPVSIWRVIGWQFVAGLLVGALVWWLSGRRQSAVSAWYGACAVWSPAALMAWGLTEGRFARVLSVFPKGSLVAVMFWEGVKVLLSVMLMALAPLALAQVDWLALLAGLVVVIKVNWLAFWWLSRSTSN